MKTPNSVSSEPGAGHTAADDQLGVRPIANSQVLEAHRKIFSTGKPVVTPAYYGQVLKQYAVSVDVPVKRGNEVLFNLAIPVTASQLSAVLREQTIRADITVGMWDEQETVIARNRDHQIFAGRKAVPSISAALKEARDQVLTTTTFEGVVVLTAIAHSPRLGWSLAVGIPQAALYAPLWRALGAISLFSLACFLVSGFIAARMARHLLEAAEQRELLIQELNHRVGNNLAVTQSLASQTLSRAETLEAGKATLEGRIAALGRAHNLLTERHWSKAELADLVARAIEPFSALAGKMVIAGGPPMAVVPRAALGISLALHELGTNSTKYEALSVAGGVTQFGWRLDHNGVTLIWKERGGPEVNPPMRKGLGTLLLEREFRGGLLGTAHLEFQPEGVVCTIHYPRDVIIPG